MLYSSQPDLPYHPSGPQVDPLGYGRVALVTGCASGIGLATTQLLLSHQFRVCGLDSRDFDYALLRQEDQGRFHFHRADLFLEQGACEEAVRICVATFGGRIDVLVNVAGVMDGFVTVEGVSDELWDRVVGVNLTVPVKMMRECVGFMRAETGMREGVIVNVASTAGLSGAVAGIAYTASKHGLVSISLFSFVSWGGEVC
jgi:NAD(P)-dependent dehydrogenase (short-subunit alcohol dehydrogenase family)